MKVKTKKKILHYCNILVVTLVIISLFIPSPNDEATEAFSDFGENLITKSSKGNIILEENEYFKKYTITCKKSLIV